MKIIECKNLNKTYVNGGNSTTVLKGVSFSINKGEFVAITGPSGSGKSTMMNIIGALDTPTSGQFFLDGQDVSKLSEDALADIRSKKIGFVFQAFNLLSRATVWRNVNLPLIYTDVLASNRNRLVVNALTNAQIEKSKFYNLSNQLSGGQMQRVAIARALVNDPEIILADEPTGNLDQKTGKAVLDTFQELSDKGKTIILITHDQYVANHAARVIKIIDGEITSDDKLNNKIK
ncbi:MAG: ABC transporter ATP-binding protein [Patescibacteria group bacterium]